MVKIMEGYKVYESVVDKKIKKEISEADWCPNLIQYATYKCKIDGLISAAYLFCPQIIEIEGYVFIEQFCEYEEGEEQNFISKLKQQYNNDKKSIELSVNTWSIGDFFSGETSELMNNLEVLTEFGKALMYFWKLRVHELFPEREIKVELGNNLMGEYGLCITMFEE